MEGKPPLYSSLNMGYLRHLTQVRVRALKGKNYESNNTSSADCGDMLLSPASGDNTLTLLLNISKINLCFAFFWKDSAPEFGQLSEVNAHPTHKSHAWIFLLLHSRSLEQGPQTSRELYWVFFYDCGLYCLISNIVMVLYQHIMIVQHQMSVIEEKVEEFRLALRQYVESASAQGGCLQ